MPFGLMVLWGSYDFETGEYAIREVSNAFRLNGSVGEARTGKKS